MKNDRMFIQTFACVALIATALCVWQENALGAVVLLLVATALVFIARNIGHLMRAYRNQKKLLNIQRQIACLMREHSTFNDVIFTDLSDIINTIDRTEQEMKTRIE